MEIINKNELRNAVEKALADLQEDCINNKQHDDISPVQEMAAVLPIILKHAYSKRVMSKGQYHDQIISELATYLKNDALSANSPYTEDSIKLVLTILLKYL